MAVSTRAGDLIEEALREVRFAEKVRSQLTNVRLVHESDTDTFNRMMLLAKKALCPECRGYGHRSAFVDGLCPECNGTGTNKKLEG